MEKGKLLIKTGKSGIYANIQITDGKLLTSLGGFIPNKSHLSLDAKDIDFERDKGVVKKIICEGNIIFEKKEQQDNPKQTNQSKNWGNYQSQDRDRGQQQNQYSSKNQQQSHSQPKYSKNLAQSPYNFVPLNDTIVTVDDDNIDQSIYHSDKKTGYIELTITNHSPIYVRDSYNQEDIKKKQEHEDKNERYVLPDFFSPTGKHAIPGSSLRGMIRTIVEILSFSKFGFTQEDRRLYFRTFADSVKGVRDDYAQYMSSLKGEEKKMLAGIIHRKGYRDYEILPAGKVTKLFGEEERKFRNSTKEIARGVYKKTNDEYLVSIKNLDIKFNNYHVKKEANTTPIQLVYETDVMDYKDDINRKAEIDVIKIADKEEYCPCFYKAYTDVKGNTRYAFGHNPYFRLPYLKTINDHIIQNNYGEKTDFATSIFGNETNFSSRIFFTDAVLQSGKVSDQPIVPKILSSPKPTTFQHYLEQEPTNSTDTRDTYNSNTKIRGNKLYWNFDPKDNWKEKKELQPDLIKKVHSRTSQYTIIKVVEPGASFTSRIYFDNLTEKELGCLLSSIDLQKNCYHKIGMVKPLGLGTISIQSSVYLSNTSNRYSNLDSEWIESIPTLSETDKDYYKKLFSKYIIDKLPIKETRSAKIIWEMPRIRELVKILQLYKDERAISKFSYMMINKPTGQVNPKTGKEKTENEFKGRPVLPKPSEIV